MDADETKKLIEHVGGPTAFARHLGLDKQPGYLQRVSNWRTRGMPAVVVLDHLSAINELRAAVSAPRRKHRHPNG